MNSLRNYLFYDGDDSVESVKIPLPRFDTLFERLNPISKRRRDKLEEDNEPIEDRQFVGGDSSNVEIISYSYDNMQMLVAFKPRPKVRGSEGGSGGLYMYYNVPFWVYEDWKKSESKGKYHWKHIRDKYKYEIIR